MSRKDFDLIAATIRGLSVTSGVRAAIAADFSFALRVTNPNFNVVRFYRVCCE